MTIPTNRPIAQPVCPRCFRQTVESMPHLVPGAQPNGQWHRCIFCGHIWIVTESGATE
jgi:hypothetical protein